jgi:hypothetical protein
MPKVIQFLFIVLPSLYFNCALPPPLIKLPIPDQNWSVTPADTSEVKVIIFNTSGGLAHGIDRTGGINCIIDGMSLGFIDMKAYAIVFLKPGIHILKLSHWDAWTMTSEHLIEIPQHETYLRIYATLFSNDIEIKESLPDDFKTRYKNFLTQTFR